MSTPETNRVWRLTERPTAAFSPDEHVELATASVPEPADGQALVRVTHLSLDPTIRGWMQQDTYLPAIGIGEVVRSMGIGEVVASKSDKYPVGALVSGLTGWQEYVLAEERGAGALQILPEGTDPLVAISLFGPTGLAAYFGLLRVGELKEGDTVLVSGAAGATGSVVGQIAKLKGCRVIGTAGGPEKCAYVVDELGFDECVDYKADDVAKTLRSAIGPDGVDVYFDNVGGPLLEMALSNLALHARIVICGAISQYDGAAPKGPRNYSNLIVKRAKMEGFLIFDYAKDHPQAFADLGQWAAEGKVNAKVDLEHGIEAVPTAFTKLFTGGNVGKNAVAL
ncbi:Putative NADP-dependent oxidoreductase [Euzebya pacifica]|uniref:NADP-dependent oxidoreductase n=1 Tax=Euzebya pacifica TaxID=1608957 RepID=A0A346Y1B2_9ACTN|nr:NADP-dependent oxidoreductase [Euzebya pacifica]AXV08259.1 Putative NADP-dependent oxidoreductase [Euzebya pacifica]